jgi:arylsulfatase A-like enzyme
MPPASYAPRSGLIYCVDGISIAMQTSSPPKARNILFIMADQLRRDYLSCYGATHLATPNIDALAQRGVRFDNAYAQGAVCGVSRMSYYTGRYMSSHGANWNFVPLPLHNPTLGDYLRPLGLRVAVVGKTHFAPDTAGFGRIGRLAETSTFAAEGGFEPYARDDGIWSQPEVPPDNRYAAYLRTLGYGGSNPWHDWANSARSADGKILSGWSMQWADRPAAVAQEHSETAYTTRLAMQFIDECGDKPWCLHLSYIKPHWPYVAPAPYHDMFGPEDVPEPIRAQQEREQPHPVFDGFQSLTASRNFSDDARRRHVIPAYMGLVKQLDDQLGVLFEFMTARGLWDDTLVVFSSDHGDYLGDHWLGEKELFHDTIVAVPLVVVHPDAAALRGATEQRLVETIDLVPSFVEAAGGVLADHQIEGRSLMPLLFAGEGRGCPRDYVVSEGDYAFRSSVRAHTGQPIDKCRMFMVRTAGWKYIHYEGLAPQLFDLRNDPREVCDRGTDPAVHRIREEHAGLLFEWLRNRRIHPTVSHAQMDGCTAHEARIGTRIGEW